ncbi:hypothetical protein CYY_006298 [Polysphondylium violaceum]|uniref:Golgi apparatus membrane protein TVP23 homolog n=1 Tax=Polysphondylium violaceum TaxID=133409 RepID=A0A8J4PSV9_9MYCE|nr:hypothetical protein CYY_006298 [Polysphondylium violaceum]
MKYSPFADEPVADTSIPVSPAQGGINGDQQQQPIEGGGKRHPVALVFHFLFKSIAIGFYILGGIFNIGFVLSFIIITLCSAFDFWTVKNVTGRLLVGLRWWNEIKDDGSNQWFFESVQNKSQINQRESFLFWVATLVTPGLWALFCLFSVFRLKLVWLIVNVVCIALSGANLVGYIKCAKDARKKVKGMAQSYIVGTIVNQAINKV